MALTPQQKKQQQTVGAPPPPPQYGQAPTPSAVPGSPGWSPLEIDAAADSFLGPQSQDVFSAAPQPKAQATSTQTPAAQPAPTPPPPAPPPPPPPSVTGGPIAQTTTAPSPAPFQQVNGAVVDNSVLSGMTPEQQTQFMQILNRDPSDTSPIPLWAADALNQMFMNAASQGYVDTSNAGGQGPQYVDNSGGQITAPLPGSRVNPINPSGTPVRPLTTDATGQVLDTPENAQALNDRNPNYLYQQQRMQDVRDVLGTGPGFALSADDYTAQANALLDQGMTPAQARQALLQGGAVPQGHIPGAYYQLPDGSSSFDVPQNLTADSASWLALLQGSGVDTTQQAPYPVQGFGVWRQDEDGTWGQIPWDGNMGPGGNATDQSQWMGNLTDPPIVTSNPDYYLPGGPAEAGGFQNWTPGQGGSGGDPTTPGNVIAPPSNDELDAFIDRLQNPQGGTQGPPDLGNVDLEFDPVQQPNMQGPSTDPIAGPGAGDWDRIFNEGLAALDARFNADLDEGQRILAEHMASRGTLGSTVEAGEMRNLIAQLQRNRQEGALDLLRERTGYGFQSAQLGLQNRAQELQRLGMDRDEAFRYAALEQDRNVQQAQLQLQQLGMDRDEAFRYAAMAADENFRNRTLELQALGMRADEAYRYAALEQDRQQSDRDFGLRQDIFDYGQTRDQQADWQQYMNFALEYMRAGQPVPDWLKQRLGLSDV